VGIRGQGLHVNPPFQINNIHKQLALESFVFKLLFQGPLYLKIDVNSMQGPSSDVIFGISKVK